MPKLVRIYNFNVPADMDVAPSKDGWQGRGKIWFVAFSVLISLNVLAVCGLATFLVLARR